jgi:hypothetical protein
MGIREMTSATILNTQREKRRQIRTDEEVEEKETGCHRKGCVYTSRGKRTEVVPWT